MAGPSGLPVVIGLLVAGVFFLALAIALWTGFGGRRTAGLSLLLGAGLMVNYALQAVFDAERSSENIAAAAVGLGIVLASAYALAKLPRSAKS